MDSSNFLEVHFLKISVARGARTHVRYYIRKLRCCCLCVLSCLSLCVSCIMNILFQQVWGGEHWNDLGEVQDKCQIIHQHISCACLFTPGNVAMSLTFYYRNWVGQTILGEKTRGTDWTTWNMMGVNLAAVILPFRSVLFECMIAESECLSTSSENSNNTTMKLSLVLFSPARHNNPPSTSFFRNDIAWGNAGKCRPSSSRDDQTMLFSITSLKIRYDFHYF